MMRRAVPFLACAALSVLALTLATPGAASDRVVALVVTGSAPATPPEPLFAALSGAEAETLRAEAPSNAELRAQMRRFAAGARAAGTALVYLDLPAVRFQDRLFVVPEGARLTRATDLFTEAVPLRAFARMAALPERGGAVVLLAGVVPDGLPEGVTAADAAPDPLPGTASTLVARGPATAKVTGVLTAALGDPADADLAAILRAMAAIEGTRLSAPPAGPIPLTAPRAAPAVVAVPVPVPPQPDTGEEAPDLAAFEKTLSPATRRNLQRALRGLGHYGGLIDGIIGRQTRAAITAFQASQEAPETGFLNPAELRALLRRG